MGRGIIDLDATLACQLQRPDKIVFVIVTEGQENASREYDRAKVLALIQARKAQGWEFVFLSADLASFDDAAELGVHSEARLLFRKTRQGSARAWQSVSSKMADYRQGVAARVRFDDADRGHQDGSKK